MHKKFFIRSYLDYSVHGHERRGWLRTSSIALGSTNRRQHLLPVTYGNEMKSISFRKCPSLCCPQKVVMCAIYQSTVKKVRRIARWIGLIHLGRFSSKQLLRCHSYQKFKDDLRYGDGRTRFESLLRDLIRWVIENS